MLHWDTYWPAWDRRAAKAARHARKAIGLTAHVIETAKFCRPRAPAGPAATEGSSGGSGGVQLAKKSAWNKLREASHVISIHDSPTQKRIHGACSWHRFYLAP